MFGIVVGAAATCIGMIIGFYSKDSQVAIAGMAIATIGAAVMSSSFLSKSDDDRD